MAEGTLLFIALALVLFFFLSPVLLIVAWMELRRRRRQGVRGAADEGRLAIVALIRVALRSLRPQRQS